MKKPKNTRAKRSKAGQAKDLAVKGLKTRHDTAKNSISNVR